jgi:hypothetical protein
MGERACDWLSTIWGVGDVSTVVRSVSKIEESLDDVDEEPGLGDAEA